MPKRTPFFKEHLKLNAKMVPFGGWEMPVSYSSIIEEHMAVRNAAGLFDIGHMGLAEVSGQSALPFLQKIATNDASKLLPGRAQYSILLNDRGGVIDDILVYRLPDKFFLVLNASNTDKDLTWFKKNSSPGIKILHRSDMAALSLQGPAAQKILSDVCSVTISSFKRNDCAEAKVFDKACLVSRTGYTGGDGFELFLDAKDIRGVWTKLLEKGAPDGLLPCGLGARDSLRIEAGLPLYGHEYTEDVSPLEAGYGWAVRFDKGDFVGRDALLKKQAEGLKTRLSGIVMEERAVPRQGYKVYDNASLNEEAGVVTSGTFSPLMNKAIGLAYLRANFPVPSEKIFVKIRDKGYAGEAAVLPFFRHKP